MKTLCLLFSLGVGGLNKYNAEYKCQDVESSGHIEYVLVSCGIELNVSAVNVLGDELAGVVNDEGCKLVSRKSRECPSGKGDSVDRRDAAHSVVVGKEGGNVGEASAVACIYNEDEDEYKCDEDCLAFASLDSVG